MFLNLISVLVLLKLGFNMYLAKNNIELSLGTTHYGSGYVLNVSRPDSGPTRLADPTRVPGRETIY